MAEGQQGTGTMTEAEQQVWANRLRTAWHRLPKETQKQLEPVLDERLKNGMVQPEDWPMRKILERIDYNNRHNSGLEDRSDDEDYSDEEEYSDDDVDNFWKQPATTEQIADAEKRLDVKLPDDYKEFLRTINGYGTMHGGTLREPLLHSVGEIR